MEKKVPKNKMKELIKKLENSNSWYIQSIYIPEKDIKEYYIDMLKMLCANSSLRKSLLRTTQDASIKNPNALISELTRRLWKSITKQHKQIIIKNETSVNQDKQENS